jgi:hypothetical protein
MKLLVFRSTWGLVDSSDGDKAEVGRLSKFYRVSHNNSGITYSGVPRVMGHPVCIYIYSDQHRTIGSFGMADPD